jgi:predicted aldo/keto reductase-like oxidoreductase
LKLETVDLLGIHGINTAELLDWTLRPGGCLEVAQEFQRQGRVRFIGFSTHAPTAVILQAIESDQFDYVNLHWYYIHQENWPAVEAAQRHDMGVFIISPSDKGGHLYNPSQTLTDLCHPLSPIVFNNLFCLSRPQVHTLSIGAARPSDFDEHLKTLPLLAQADAHLAPVLERLEHQAQAVLGEDWLNHWREGLPTPEDTPGQVNIPVILWLRNLLLAYDMAEFAKARYNLLGNGGHWFPGQKAEAIHALDFSDCLRHSPYASKIPAMLADTHQRLGGEAVARLSNA